MWLTGFDAPSLHTLYVDKPMRDHGLLQAIARVNRVFRDKPGGLVVDYIGIGEDLRASLRPTTRREVDDAGDPGGEGRRAPCEKYEVICALLHPSATATASCTCSADRANLFLDVLQPRPRKRGARSANSSTPRRALARWLCARAHTARRDRARARRSASSTSSLPRYARSPSPRRAGEPRQPSRRYASSCQRGPCGRRGRRRPRPRRHRPPGVSVLSDEFLDSLTRQDRAPEHPGQAAREAPRRRDQKPARRNQHPRPSGSATSRRLSASLRARAAQSAEVVERLVEIAKELRDARHRHEELGLSRGGGRLLRRARGRRRGRAADPDSPRSPMNSSRASAATSPSTGPTARRPRRRSEPRSSASSDGTANSSPRPPAAAVHRRTT